MVCWGPRALKNLIPFCNGSNLRWSTPWSAIRPWRQVPNGDGGFGDTVVCWTWGGSLEVQKSRKMFRWFLGFIKSDFKGMPCFVSSLDFFLWKNDMIWIFGWRLKTHFFCFFELKEKNLDSKWSQCKFWTNFLKFECYNIQLQINKKWYVFKTLGSKNQHLSLPVTCRWKLGEAQNRGTPNRWPCWGDQSGTRGATGKRWEGKFQL